MHEKKFVETNNTYKPNGFIESLVLSFGKKEKKKRKA